MSERGAGIGVALAIIVTVWVFAAGGPLVFVVGLGAIGAYWVGRGVFGLRTEQVALLLSALIIVAGLVAAGVRVADRIGDQTVEVRGELDALEILRSFHPTGSTGQGDPRPTLRRGNFAYLEEAEGTMVAEDASAEQLLLWGVGDVAPWLLAAVVLALLAPILRAADRGDPFRDGGADRLALVGGLLMVGIPAIVVLRYVAAESAMTLAAGPVVTPTLELSPVYILPGLFVLVLAGIFRRGAELRDLERHTV